MKEYGGNYTWSEADELYGPSTEVVVLLSVCYGAISVLSVAGNSLVMWAVLGSRRMQRSATNWLLANLAFADVIIGLFVVPFQFQAALLQRWDLPDFMCSFCPFVQTLSVNVSIFTLTTIAVRRYRAVAKPLKVSRWQARFTIITIWAAGIVLAMPMIITLQVREVPISNSNPHLTKPFCDFVGVPFEVLKWYRRLVVGTQYFLPLVIIIVMYVLLARRLWGAQPPGNAQNQRDATLLRNKKRVIKMLVVVVALFALCWLPLQTYNVLQDIFPKINEYRYINIIWFCCDWLAMSNSVCNPFVYGIYNDNFRRRFRSRCVLCSRLLNMPQPAQSLDTGRVPSSVLYHPGRQSDKRRRSSNLSALAATQITYRTNDVRDNRLSV
ncbi:Hypothetical predicted protein [Cloeon dipterum]|uniref:G-protein coupled receptors family 1 profile domain-containing protein n=1 Tax=Cloeon dipterum TaxID=197152 RepID=A0A8S1E315_9INSE|nr:Hypothetical predicted protein [Cloeon dipterum]